MGQWVEKGTGKVKAMNSLELFYVIICAIFYIVVGLEFARKHIFWNGTPHWKMVTWRLVIVAIWPLRAVLNVLNGKW